MEVRLCVKMGTDISLIESEFGEMGEAFPRNDEDDSVDYYLGDYEDEDEDGVEWLYDDCVKFCGYCCGAIPDSMPWIMGNGEWAQGLIGCMDFSSYAMTEEEKLARIKISEVYREWRLKGQADRESRSSS